jgi:hypothetical protein
MWFCASSVRGPTLAYISQGPFQNRPGTLTSTGCS